MSFNRNGISHLTQMCRNKKKKLQHCTSFAVKVISHPDHGSLRNLEIK